MIGREAVDRGIEDEADVERRLRALGWGVVPFGIGAWNPDEYPSGDPAVLARIRATRGPLRHAPDLLAARKGAHAFVEVVNCAGHRDRALELAKMAALDVWTYVAPVFLVDVADWTARRHYPVVWAYDAVSPPTRETNHGSGDLFAWFGRIGDQPFAEVFA